MTVVAEPTTFRSALAEAEGEQVGETEGGNAEGASTETTTEPPATTEPQKYKAKVNGQDVDVTIEEALAGYQRQSDYTSKTQELAVERQRLAQAEAMWSGLEEDPAGTLARLAEHFDVDNLTPPQELDPLEKSVAELQTFAEQQREAQFQAEVEQEISRIQQTYNDPELEPTALLQHAVDRDIGNLDAAYRDMKFTALLEAATKQRQAERAAEDAAAEAAKRAAAVVDGGTNRGGATTNIGGDRPKSVREAFEAAQQEFLA